MYKSLKLKLLTLKLHGYFDFFICRGVKYSVCSMTQVPNRLRMMQPICFCTFLTVLLLLGKWLR